MNVQTLKGFRDFLPKAARKRQYVINIFKQVFESFGFEPLETPTLEYEEILTGKYGTEGDKLMYRFEDNGKRRVAMRYDQTVPLARVVAQYQHVLPSLFKRYQIQNVWRADNTQKGRFREFTQCDIDTVGTYSLSADVEIMAVVNTALKKLGFEKFVIEFNTRNLLFKKIKEAGIPDELQFAAIRAIDKIDKVGWAKIQEELIREGISIEQAQNLDTVLSITQSVEEPEIDNLWNLIHKMGINSENIRWTPSLARGLDYYTGLIFEVKIDDYPAGSVCGGGRYDNLIGMFAGRRIPAVGCAFGFDRIIEAMEMLNLFPKEIEQSAKVLVTIFDKEFEGKALAIASQLRANTIATELWVEPGAKIEKQLKYADAKGIPFVVIIGSNEAVSNTVTVKNLKTREQQTIGVDQLATFLQTR